ncbi:transposase [Paraburkholderia sp. CNPSo 3274]|uniref:transposase n=1 Tax=Paraburkholderia sp. CNPSo 3274 TaxID=2940932 RepID=UPI0020B8E843|nr:transposase [Paraburkholderia sp. CNPSo 3274]MCP3711826.1 transposase [Paraburkholderia sp. CNPSo 3274]
MSAQEEGLLGRLVIGRKRDSRRKYDEAARRELIEACLKPGVSIARTAVERGINPNLVRTWTTQHQRRQGRAKLLAPAGEPAIETPTEPPGTLAPAEPLFVQVITPVRRRPRFQQTAA